MQIKLTPEILGLDEGLAEQACIGTPVLFGILGSAADIDAGFTDIAAIADRCRYRDCTHTSEPGCAVLKAVAEGEIARDHYENYLKLKKESEFNQMSYSEKRKKREGLWPLYKERQKGL